MPADTHPWRAGLAVGLLGYAAVAAFYALFDVVAARGTLFTVNMLSRSLFLGAPDPSLLQFPVDNWLAGIFWYNAVHLVISLGVGLFVVGLLEHVRRRPARAAVAMATIVAGYIVTIVVVGLLSRTIRPVLPWWSIVVVNSGAAALGGAYLLRRRPALVAPLLGGRLATRD